MYFFHLESLISFAILQCSSGANHLELSLIPKFNGTALNKTALTSDGSHISGVPMSLTLPAKLKIWGFSWPPQVWQFARMAYRTQKNTYDYSCIIKDMDQDQPNEGNISSLQVFSGLCLVPGPMLSWAMEAQVIPGQQTCCSPLMRGREDPPGTGNGIADTEA